MYEKIPLKGLGNEEWLRLRKTGLGGSDAGAVCGLNPYSSPMKVFADKTSDSVEGEDNEAIRIGRDLEQYVAERFMEATGLKVRRSNYMYRSVEHPCMIADVDRFVAGEDAGLECKTASAYNAGKWADAAALCHAVLPLYGRHGKADLVPCRSDFGEGVHLPEAYLGGRPDPAAD